MKKIAKISLVAAIAVAGFTTANAQPLEEAIKNVDVTGSVVYRYNDYKNDIVGGTSTNTNNYKIATALSSKVNEDVKFNSRFVVGAPSSTGTGDAGFATLSSSENADQNVGVELTNANFAYTGVKNTTVNVGKQGLTTPWTVATDINGNEQTGTGILALSTVGPVTFAGAYFNQTNLGKSGGVLADSTVTTNTSYAITGTDGVHNAPLTGTVTIPTTSQTASIGALDIATVGAIVVAGPVTIDAWYLDMQETFDTYTVGAKSSFDLASAKLGVDARYVSLNLDSSDLKNAVSKIALTGKAGIFDAKVAYAMTDKEGGLTALDQDATSTLLGWNLTSNQKTDADYWQAVAGVDILSNLNLSANYGSLKYISAANSTTELEEEEIYAQLLYKMSKNLTTYVRYGEYTKETIGAASKTNDDTRGRLQVAYTF